MDPKFSRQELLDHLIPLMHDPKSSEALRQMPDAQLRIIAETLDELSKWQPDRREETRKPVMRRVQVSPADGTAFRMQYGLQEDISAHGIGIFLTRPMPIGARVKIHSNGQDSTGTVRRCQAEKTGWAIGILLDLPAGAAAESQPKASGDSPD